MMQCLLPTTYDNNWYITAYVLFYAIHTQLNMLIDKMNQRQLLGSVMVLFFLYCVMGMICTYSFCATGLTWFITIYFFIAYIKKYMKKVIASKKINMIMLFLGSAGIIFLVLFTDFLGHHFTRFENGMMFWFNRCNPLTLMIALALFNLVRQKLFVSKSINYISSLSLLIYVIHGNLFFRTYTRPWIWYKIYSFYGHTYIVLHTIMYSVALMFIVAIISMLYKITLQRIAKHIDDLIYKKASKVFYYISEKIMAIK